MLTESEDEEQTIARVAALDIGKTEVPCCVRSQARTLRDGDRRYRLTRRWPGR